MVCSTRRRGSVVGEMPPLATWYMHVYTFNVEKGGGSEFFEPHADDTIEIAAYRFVHMCTIRLIIHTYNYDLYVHVYIFECVYYTYNSCTLFINLFLCCEKVSSFLVAG